MQELYGPRSVTYDTLRASACIYFAVSYGVTSIEEIEEKNGVASSIAKIVGWKDGTKGVQNILKTFIENPSINISYPNKRFNNLSTRKISSDSPSKKLRRDGEKIGMSDEDIAITISRARLKRGMSPKRAIVSKKIVVKERKRDGGRKVKTPHRQTGNRDANSDWAKTRLFMVKHFKNMLKLGAENRIDTELPQHYNPTIHGYTIGQILFVDEHSQKCKFRPIGDYQDIYLDHNEDANDRSTEEEQVISRIKPKFAKRANGVFGVALINNIGTKMKPCRYTGIVVANETWQQHLQDERARTDKLRNKPFATVDGVRQQWPAWRENDKLVGERIKDKYSNIKVIIKHVIDEGNRLYQNTLHKNTWMIYHDALTQWWADSSIKYMESLGFSRARLVCLPDDESVIKRYRGKVTGDCAEPR
eukprot:g8752.t1